MCMKVVDGWFLDVGLVGGWVGAVCWWTGWLVVGRWVLGGSWVMVWWLVDW